MTESVRVLVTFLGILRDQFGEPSIEFTLPQGATLRDLLDALAPQAEQRLTDWAWDRARKTFADRVMVSRNMTAGPRDETALLADGDEILVFPPLAGG